MNIEQNTPRHNNNNNCNCNDSVNDYVNETTHMGNENVSGDSEREKSLEEHFKVIKEEGEQFTSRFNVLKTLVDLVGKHGKSTVLWALLIFMVYGNVIKDAINPPKKQMEQTLENYNRRAELEHKKGLEMRQNANVIIPGILETILYRVNADRVMILELHNGGVNNYNLPFNHFTATYETVSDMENMDYVKDQYQHQFTSSYSQLMNKLHNYGYVYIEDIDDVPVSHWTKKLKKNGVKSGYFCTIYGDKLPVAILAITSNTHNLDESLVNKNINPYTQRIGLLLKGISKT